MSLKESFSRLICRFRYPVSLPEDVANDIGIPISNSLEFKDFLQLLSSLNCRPTKLRKFMPRCEAEAAFKSALKKENFKSITFFSYYFTKGWVIFALYFDEKGRLRRLNLQYPSALKAGGCDLYLGPVCEF